MIRQPRPAKDDLGKMECNLVKNVPTNANKHQENHCWQFAVLVGKKGCQGHASSAKIFANNLLKGSNFVFVYDID